TGSGVLASALAMDKLRTKRIWQAERLPSAPYAVLTKDSDLKAVARRLGMPLFVKPASEGSSVGMTKVKRAAELEEAFALAVNYDSVVIAEKFVDGPELTVAILGEQALPIIRIETPREFYDYEAKYIANDTRYLIPFGAGSAYWLAHSPLFPLRAIELCTSVAHAPRADLEAVMARHAGGNFFAAPIDELRVALERVPWVRKAAVRRVWPHRLEVTIEEHVALARWGGEGLLNTYGERFS